MTLLGTHSKTDRQIQTDVIAEYEHDWRFRPAEIGVEVDDGTVTLTGTVSTYLKLGEAADLAGRVAGVKDVANKLTVALPGSDVHDDTKIAQAVRHALAWDVAVPEERIDSVVRNGIVTLKGEVGYWYQRKSAVNAARRIAGVLNVNDHLVVVPPARRDEHLEGEIKATLARRLPLERIDVVVDAAAVILAGTVPSYWIRKEAEDIAWSTTGVRNVINRLRIEF
jgi:osmotically-inducible protein OsmY